MPETQDNGTQAPQSAAARLFDLRSMIGGLFVVYGIMLTVAGFFTSPANLAKAAGININLWMGIAMLIVGVLFLVWWRLNPIKRDSLRMEENLARILPGAGQVDRQQGDHQARGQ